MIEKIASTMNAHAEYHSSSSSGYSKKIRYYFPPFQLSTFQKLLHSTNVLRLPLISSTCNSVHASFFRMIPYFSIFLPSLLLLLPLHFSNDLFVYAQPFTCFGLLPSDPGVCNFQGTCLSQDTCQCFPGYGGLDCSQPMCNGIRADELGLVCSGRGACIAPETCLCVDPNKYGGQFCEQVKCFGIFSGNSTVCSSHGSCVGSDLCQCREGYSGVKCEIPKCFGIEGNNPLACSGRGKCVEMDSCTCNSGFYGPQCERVSCFSQVSHVEMNIASLQRPHSTMRQNLCKKIMEHLIS